MTISLSDKNRKHLKKKKMLFTSISPFHNVFFKTFFRFPKEKILDSPKLKEFADDNFKFDENGESFPKG